MIPENTTPCDGSHLPDRYCFANYGQDELHFSAFDTIINIMYMSLAKYTKKLEGK
jgi:hypothetical protein